MVTQGYDIFAFRESHPRGRSWNPGDAQVICQWLFQQGNFAAKTSESQLNRV